MPSLAHSHKVSLISAQVADFYRRKRPFRVFHGSTNSTRVLQFKRDELVDISNLDAIIDINPTTKVAYVEPNVPMDKLVAATLRHNLIPPVVMEFPGITVGGAIQGNGGESSSFKWGAFDQTIKSHEIITGDGTVLTTSAEHSPDLFYGIPGTAGTLGILTAAEINLVPAKKYVELQYIPVNGFVEAQNVIESYCNDTTADFIDGIMCSSSAGVVIVGRLQDEASSPLERFRRAHDQWYYLHVGDKLASNPDGWHESVPLVDYLFRYDRGAFWVGRFAFEMARVPYTRFMRWLLDPVLHTRKLYQALQESGQSQQHIVQDLTLPSESFVEFCQYIDRKLDIYPLWICPMRVNPKAIFQLNNLPTPLIINVGVWGNRIANYDDFVAKNRNIEQKVLALGGKKWSYAYSFFTENEFWKMYDKRSYLALRKKYHSEQLPTIHDKVTVTTRMPIHKKKAFLKTLIGIAGIKITK